MSATMTMPQLAMPQQPDPAAVQGGSGQDPTASDPSRGTPEQKQEQLQLSDEEKKWLLWLRRDYKMSWGPNRRARVKAVLKAFEVLKGNPYLSFDPDGFQWYDPISAAINGTQSEDDVELYRYNNNIYQMLCLSFMAALSPQVPKVRYQPDDADNELDQATARRASTMMAIIERKNTISSLQKQELLHLWTGGCYFSYSRYVIDGDRAGVTNVPVIEPVDTQVLPDRFVCPSCGEVTPANDIGPWARPTCPGCQAEFDEGDFYPAESLPIPQEVGKKEVPNGMVMINVFGLMNADGAPYATDLYETPILDLEVETDVASIRGSYPDSWTRIREQVGSSGSAEGDADRMARLQQSSAAASRSGYMSASLVTYSRCWIQPWAFNRLEDQKVAESLKEKFPNGCKLVSCGDIEFLEAVPEKLTEHWSWCGTVRGMGLYPFAVGDAALDIQERINDTANIVAEHMDRTASPTILVDEDAVDAEALSGQAMPPGRMTTIKRKGANMAKPISEVLFQPRFQIDNAIYEYGENLIMLAQLVSGVQPQIFGGSDPNVQTASGQAQMLNTALGRLGLFWDQIREEHATRSENSVKCFAKNMPEKVRHVVEGDTDSGFENEYILLSEMQGSFCAYPESDQGFPATYAEIRDRLMTLLQDAANPFVQEFLSDPDNMKVVARYVAPPGIKTPNEAARTKYKRLLSELSKSEPYEVMPEEAAAFGIVTQTPMFMPQTSTGVVMLDDFDADSYDLIVKLCMEWGKNNWKMRETNPAGYENVRAFLRQASQKQAEQAVRAAVTAAQTATEDGPPGAGAPQAPAETAPAA
jgi:hypothetical protein